MNLVEEFDEFSFDNKVLKSDVMALVEFGAVWCGPCKRQLPILEQIASEYSNKLLVAKIDIDSAPGAVAKFKIKSVPTLFFIKNGEVVEQKTGLMNLITLKNILKEKFDI